MYKRQVERGTLKVGDEVELVGLSDEKRKVVVTGVEMFKKTLDAAETGDNIGALLRGIQRDEIERGQVLSKPGSIHPHTKFKGPVSYTHLDVYKRQTDTSYTDMDFRKQVVIAVEYLPGQFDQRASSAEECLQFIAPDEKPTVKSAVIYIIDGELSNNCLLYTSLQMT